ncbi:MAG: hypothetical protein ACRDTE_18635 [Pseudonocardiaceae bacterium]
MSESIRDMLAREAGEAEARAEAEERGDARALPGQRGQRPATDPAQVYAVRFPASRLAELRQVADDLGEPPTALIRRWVLERLDQRNAPADADDPPPPASPIRLVGSRRRWVEPYEQPPRRA